MTNIWHDLGDPDFVGYGFPNDPDGPVIKKPTLIVGLATYFSLLGFFVFCVLIGADHVVLLSTFVFLLGSCVIMREISIMSKMGRRVLFNDTNKARRRQKIN